MKTAFKSVAAVVAGFASVAILSILSDVLVESLGTFPGANHPEMYEHWMLFVALVYRSLFTVVGGYVVARIAPYKPMQHVYALMVLGGVAGVAGAAANWSLVNPGQEWYPVLLAITGPLFVRVGGKLFSNKTITI